MRCSSPSPSAHISGALTGKEGVRARGPAAPPHQSTGAGGDGSRRGPAGKEDGAWKELLGKRKGRISWEAPEFVLGSPSPIFPTSVAQRGQGLFPPSP